MAVEIKDLGPARTHTLAASIKQRLAAVLDSAYLDNALPEYVLVLLANRHDAAKIKAELGSFLGVPQADEFTEWLMREYEAVRTVADGVMASPPHSVKRPVLGASRMFEAAMRDATGVERQRRMQVEPPSLLSSTTCNSSGSSSKENRRRSPDGRVPVRNGRELPSGRRKNGRRVDEERLEREALDRELEAITRPPAPKRILEARTAAAVEEKPRKCQYWPSCKAGDACPFIHPTEPCRFFPTCSFGDQCIYIHPSLPCRFQDKCANPNCNYQHKSPAVNGQAALTVIQPAVQYASYGHPSVAQHHQHHQHMQHGFYYRSAAQATIICRFHPKCANPQCPFLHPSSTPCRYGEGCTRPDCTYTHPASRHGARSKVNAPCRFGRQCSRVNCPFQHLSSERAAVLMEGVTSTMDTSADGTKQAAPMQAAAETLS